MRWSKSVNGSKDSEEWPNIQSRPPRHWLQWTCSNVISNVYVTILEASWWWIGSPVWRLTPRDKLWCAVGFLLFFSRLCKLPLSPFQVVKPKGCAAAATVVLISTSVLKLKPHGRILIFVLAFFQVHTFEWYWTRLMCMSVLTTHSYRRIPLMYAHPPSGQLRGISLVAR